MNVKRTTLWLTAIACLPIIAAGQIDPCTLVWQRVSANSPGKLIGQASAYDSQRQVAVLFGGNNPLTGILYTSNTWELDGNTWVLRTSGAPPARKKRRHGLR